MANHRTHRATWTLAVTIATMLAALVPAGVARAGGLAMTSRAWVTAIRVNWPLGTRRRRPTRCPDSHADSHGRDTRDHAVDSVDGSRAGNAPRVSPHHAMNGGQADF